MPEYSSSPVRFNAIQRECKSIVQPIFSMPTPNLINSRTAKTLRPLKWKTMEIFSSQWYQPGVRLHVLRYLRQRYSYARFIKTEMEFMFSKLFAESINRALSSVVVAVVKDENEATTHLHTLPGKNLRLSTLIEMHIPFDCAAQSNGD